MTDERPIAPIAPIAFEVSVTRRDIASTTRRAVLKAGSLAWFGTAAFVFGAIGAGDLRSGDTAHAVLELGVVLGLVFWLAGGLRATIDRSDAAYRKMQPIAFAFSEAGVAVRDHASIRSSFTRWPGVDGYLETPVGLVVVVGGRPSLLPLRCIPADRLANLRSLLARKTRRLTRSPS